MISKLTFGTAILLLTACTVENKQPPSVADTVTAVVVPPTPAVVVDSSAVVAPPSPARKTKSDTPHAGGERDSAVQPIMGIGADGKIRPVKK